MANDLGIIMNKEQQIVKIAIIRGEIFEIGEDNGSYMMLSDKDGECILLSGISKEICAKLGKRIFKDVEIVIREVIDK